MKGFLKIFLLAAVVALGVWLWFVLFPSPETIIRKQLTKLAADISFSQDEGNLMRIAGAESVSGFFSTNVEVYINVPGHEQATFYNRAEITQAALGSRQAVKSLEVKFPDANVTLAPDKQSASVDATVDVNVSGELDAIVQEVKITFEKSEGKWLIKKVVTAPPLSQLPILNFELARARFIIFA